MGELPANDIHQQADAIRVRVELATVFNPSGPVDDRELLAGRQQELTRLLSAVSQRGQHAILFGERGVGKTSLASLVHEFWEEVSRQANDCIALRYNCDPDDSFASIWARIAELLADEYTRQGRPLPAAEVWQGLYAEVTHEAGVPHSIRRLLDLANDVFIIVIDEFDQVDDEETVRQFASLIKGLSDHLTPATLILVGVADTVDDLIEDHASIDRATIQVALPRMSSQELRGVIQSRYDRVGLSAPPEVVTRMAWLSQGLPHYTHRLGQEAGFAAVDGERLTVTEADVRLAIERAIEHAQESIRVEYRDATTSPRRDALFGAVLLACALARSDDLGFFAPVDVRAPLQRITGKPHDIPQFGRHLKQFSSPERGEVLQVIGEQRRRRYRFANPLLRTYVVLKSLNDGLLDLATLRELSPGDGPSLPDDQRQLL